MCIEDQTYTRYYARGDGYIKEQNRGDRSVEIKATWIPCIFK